MENYVIAMGIRGFKKWNAEFEGWYKGARELNLLELNQFKAEVMEPLYHLREEFKREDSTVKTMTAAVTALLMETGIEEKMLGLRKSFRTWGIRPCQGIRSGLWAGNGFI